MNACSQSKTNTAFRRATILYEWFFDNYNTYRNEINKKLEMEVDRSKHDAVIKQEINMWHRMSEGLTDEQLGTALRWFERHEANGWVPREPRFRRKAHGLLDPAVACEVASATHECFAVREAYIRISQYDRNHLSSDMFRRRFNANYNLIAQQIVDGTICEKPIAVPLTQQPEENIVDIPISREERATKATKHMKRISEILNQATERKNARTN